MTTTTAVDEIDLAALPPPPDFLLETAEENETMAHHHHHHHHHPSGLNAAAVAGTKEVTIPERSLSVADAVKTLNEIRHQPASPGVVRRAQSMRATTDSSAAVVGLGRGHPPGSLLAKTLGTTPKARHLDAHHTFTLNKNAAKLAPSNHSTKTLPKHMPSHPLNAVS